MMTFPSSLNECFLPAQIAVGYVALPRAGSPDARFARYRFLGGIRAEEREVVGVFTGRHRLSGSNRKLQNTIHNFKWKFPITNKTRRGVGLSVTITIP
jgi:hypothetical protein